MTRFATLRRRPLSVARAPRRGFGRTSMGEDSFGAPEPERDPRGEGEHSTLPYRTAMELLHCIDIMGPGNEPYCHHDILGTPLPEFRAVAGITSPVPFVSAEAPDGSVSTRIGGIAVRIEPDLTSTDPAMTNKAETKFNSTSTQPSATTLNGRVNAITPGNPEANITIQTVYGPGTSPGGSSAYGRGTTADDVAAGNTSLGFHESRHGVDFLRYMANVPQPVFAGAIGMTVAQFQAAQAAFTAAWSTYFTEMKHRSVHHTDCAGSTSAASPTVQAVCVHTHAPVPNP